MRHSDKKLLFIVLEFLTDIIGVNISLWLTALVFYNFNLRMYFNNYIYLIIISSILLIVLMNIFKLYKPELKIKRKDFLARIIATLFIFIFFISVFNLVVPSYNYRWLFLLVFYLFTIAFILAGRLIILKLKQNMFKIQNIAIVGEVEESKRLIDKIRTKSDTYQLKSIIVDKYDKKLEEKLIDGVDSYFGFKWLKSTVERFDNIDILIIAYNNLNNKTKARLFNLKVSSKTRVYILPENYDPNFFDPELIP